MLVTISLLLVSAKPGKPTYVQQDAVDCEQDSLKIAEPIISMSPAPIVRGDIEIVSATPEPILRTVEIEPARMEVKLAPAQPMLKVARPLAVSTQSFHRIDHVAPTMEQTYVEASPAPILRTAEIEPARIYAPVEIPALEMKLAPKPLLKVARPLEMSTQWVQRTDQVAPPMWQTRLETAPAPIALDTVKYVEHEAPIVQTKLVKSAEPLIRTQYAIAPMETKTASTVFHAAPATKSTAAYSYGKPLAATSFQSYNRQSSIASPQFYNTAVVADMPKYYAPATAPLLQRKYEYTYTAPMAMPKYYAPAPAPYAAPYVSTQYYNLAESKHAEYKTQPIVSEVAAQEPCEK